MVKQSFDFLSNAECIILPKKLMALDEFNQLSKDDSNICVKTYEIYRGRHPASYNIVIEQLCAEFIQHQIQIPL